MCVCVSVCILGCLVCVCMCEIQSERARERESERERERERERESEREREGIVLECCGEEGATCQRIHFSGLHLWSRALGNGLRNQNVYQCPSQGGQA